MSDNIKVVVKVRPLISREIEENLSYQWRVKNNTLYQLEKNGKECGPSFTFDKVYDENTPTKDVYNDVAKPIVEAAAAGINGTIFAYGQTSSGKTYTMTGSEMAPGIIPLAVLDLFNIIKKKEDRDFLLRVAYIEIYNETIKDLLDVTKDKIKIYESIQGGVKVEATEKVTSSPQELLDIMGDGEANRQIGATNMNEKSSRSHSIFQIIIESREHAEGDAPNEGPVNVSILNLVDLAGSERSGQTGAKGIRFKEGTHINKSLSALALVIKQLSEGQKYTNYRDSKLTRILQNSLGGNAKTSIICAVTPAALEETISTLQFANRAKAIKNKPEVNAVATEATMISELTKTLSKLLSQLENKKNVEQNNRMLQKKIKALQSQILNGLGQCATTDNSKADRRKTWAAPRRWTTDSLHTINEDGENTIAVPRFCTPAIKYNPATLDVLDFQPIARQSGTDKMEPVSEEYVGGHTTPPSEKRVNFSDEIIEIGSDDDKSTDAPLCSPYHKCYESSKTPPCVLREKAKTAQKSLNEIVELTEREKMYTPDVVELLEKLEQNTSVIVDLRDKVTDLNRICIEKDYEIDSLKNNAARSQEVINEVNAKMAELESLYRESLTKLTDLEVIYETSKRKAKIREEDLLSLLEERKIQVPKQCDFPIMENKDLNNLMDMSKDISLVNSDNEPSIVHKNDHDSSSKLSDSVADLQSQINSKCAMVEHLEAKVNLQKLEIDKLECTNEKIQRMLDSLNLKISEVDTENYSLKSTVDSLMSNIKSQKDTLDSANNNFKFYYELTKELQQKLDEKIININVLEDSVLEDLIANEEKIIANNDNLKNIIHSLKSGIDTRNKEISRLTLQNSCNDNYKTEIESKDKQINTLEEEVEKLKAQAIKEISLVTELNDTLTRTQTDLKNQEESLQEKIKILTNQNQDNMNKIEQLNEDKKKLVLTVSETEIREKEVKKKTEDLAQQLEIVYSALNALEEDIKQKNSMISTLNTDKHKHILKFDEMCNRLFNKIQSVLSDLNGQDIEISNDMGFDYESAVKHCFSMLDAVELEIIVLKESSFKANNNLETELQLLKEKYENEVIDLQAKIESLTQSDTTVSDLNKKLKQQNEELITGIYSIRQELERKTKDCSEFESKLQDNIADFEKIRQHLEYRENEIATIKDNESQLIKELEKVKTLLKEKEATYDSLREEIEDLNATYLKKISTERINLILTEKDTEIANLVKSLTNVETTLPDKYAEIIRHAHMVSESIIYKEQILKTILDKVTDLTNNFSIQNSFICDEDDKSIESYEQIPHMLAKIGVHVDVLVQKINENAEDQITALENALTEAKIQIKELTTCNLKMNTDLAQHDEKYRRSLAEIEAIEKENKGLANSLLECNNLLQSLHQEISTKAFQLMTFENNTRIVKEKFISIESEMRKRINDLEMENKQIRENYTELENHIKNHSLKKEDQSLLDFEEIDFKSLSVRNSLSNLLEKTEINVPKSLLSICLSKVIQALNANDIDKSTTPSNSTSEIDFAHVEVQAQICQCNALTTELAKIQEENQTLKHTLQFLKLANEKLIQEQEEVRTEVNLLLEPATDLYKKIGKHRTNLSTLTATTYAENKALKSQVKVLQHHHSRFHNVCQKDIPQFKEQLIELYTMLKAESLIPDMHNNSIKRYSLPDVLDKNVATFKNDSSLDGDLLMLDTNVTLTTSADSTLVGHDQTCFDITQTYLETELTTEIGPDLQVDMKTLAKNNQTLSVLMEVLREENQKLKDEVKNLSNPFVTSNYKVDVDNTTNFSKGLPQVYENDCEKCKEKNKIIARLEELSQEMPMIKKQKNDLEEKYNNLLLEIPSSDALVRKLGALEKEHNHKILEVTNLTNALSKNKRELKQLQEENDTLSNQVMDNISEADDLRTELDILKESNTKLKEKYTQLEQSIQSYELKASETCPQCLAKEKLLQKHLTDSESLLNISQRDLDTSLRCNKIYTLQNELDASKEDCKKITEEVATIRNHLERSNLSMNQTMDDNMGESNIFTFTKDFEAVDPHATSKFVASMPKILEEKYLDVYSIDKTECLNYYVEKTGAEKENFNHDVLHDVKIIEVMKSLYNNLMTTHGNEVQNLRNQLKSFEESKIQLQSRINDITSDYTKACEELDVKEKSIDYMTKILNLVKNNTRSIIDEVLNNSDSLKNTKLVTIFKENILKVLDKEFSLTTTQVFESLIDSIASKHQNDICNTMESYTKLQQNMETLMSELNNVNENLLQMKEQLSDKENDYNLLKAQKDRVHEISNAVTLDIVKKEQELSETIRSGCQMLLENNIINQEDINLSLRSTKSVTVLFERLISKQKLQDKIQQTDFENVKEKLVQECTSLKNLLNDKETELFTLRLQNEKIKEINKAVTLDIVQKESELQKQISSNEELSKDFENKMSENNDNICLVQDLRRETCILLERIAKKESTIQTLESELNGIKSKNQDTQIAELINKIQSYNAEINDFRSINAMITKEKESYAEELQKSGEIIRQKSEELEKMTADVLILTESVKEKTSLLENISLEFRQIKEQNNILKDDNSALSVKVNEVQQNYEQKCKEITRLEMNIKTHEKSVQIQCSMVKRLQKQKDEDNTRIQELANKCTTLQRDFDTLQSTLASTREEMTSLQNLNNILETRVINLETELEATQKDRPSLDGINTNSRRRRQSLHDSKRLFAEVKQELDEHTKMEAMFASRSKPEDLFMAVDEDSSNRSTPARSSSGRRRDSSFTHVDLSEKDEDPSSRPSSVQATRLRRQSIHDLHRSVGHTPSPRESLLATRLPEDNVVGDGTEESQTATLKATLSACRQELEELKERFREVDEECEICAEYLREKDEQCCRLVKEKAVLTSTVAELKEALEKSGLNLSRNAETKRSFSNAAVNTDEDWTNLYSVVVDRMSFDAEVQKNKNLTMALEEFRLKNREYKVQAARMHKVIEKYAAKDTSIAAKELEAKKEELDSLRQELEEWKQRFKELDEECETCAEYLRERDEQCRKLSEANKLLRTKLEAVEQEKEESQETVKSSRKKRQSVHDLNRDNEAASVDATTDTSADLLSFQDESSRVLAGDAANIKRLTMMVERLSRQKKSLEQQLANSGPLYVATGSAIVQNQQISDVMKENQRLRKQNIKLVKHFNKRGKSYPDFDQENNDTAEQG